MGWLAQLSLIVNVLACTALQLMGWLVQLSLTVNRLPCRALHNSEWVGLYSPP